MRSLTWKLILAFWSVSLLGIMLVIAVAVHTVREGYLPYMEEQNERENLVSFVQFQVEKCYEAYGRWPSNLATCGVREELPYGMLWTIADKQGQEMYRSQVQNVDDFLPIDVNGRTVGYLAYEMDAHNHDKHGRNVPWQRSRDYERHGAAGALVRGIMRAGGAVALTALLMGLTVARNITRPVRRLTEATRAIAKGNLDHRVPVKSKDELGQLAQSFNTMAGDLSHSMEVRQRMTADIAHDLRTPVSVIMGHAEGVKDGVMDAEQTIHVIHDEAIRLNRLIDDLRTLSLADAGELSMMKRPTNILSLLKRVQSAHLPHAQAKGIALDVDVAPDLPDVSLDPDRMAQVLDNLVSNGIRHTDEGGVTVMAEQLELGVRLIVADTGCGIAADHLANIFNRFYRADASRHGSSSGLGLAIAKSIVEQHGGTITAASTVDHGTTFIVDLPLKPYRK